MWRRDGVQKELLLSYVLVLVLRAESWHLSAAHFKKLAEELRMQPADVAARFRALGAVYKTSKVCRWGLACALSAVAALCCAPRARRS